MKIISVNVGLPQELTWRGETILTGIVKAPVEGPVLVRRLNLEAVWRVGRFSGVAP